MTLGRVVRLLTVPLLVASCVDPGPGAGEDHVQVTAQAIIGGQAATVGQFPTVVAIIIEAGTGGLCTGTLVAPNIVLTAAHCVDPGTLQAGSQAQVTNNTYVIFDDTDVRDSGGGFYTTATATVPMANFNNPTDPDVGLIFLSTEVTDRTPSPINLTSSKAPVGIQLDMVGFGKRVGNNDNSFGVLQYIENKATSACATWGESDSLFLCHSMGGSGICSGDSGGPAFAEIDGVTKVVGITSWGDANDCSIVGAHQRTDAQQAIDFLQAEAPELVCRQDGACDEVCGTGDLPADLDCATPCGSDDDCADEQYCDEDRGECLPDPGTPGGLGSECENGSSCASGQCASDGEEQLCSQSCGEAEGECPDGFRCTGSGLCWPGDEGGGCNAGGGARGGLAGLLLIGLAFLRRRRAA